LPPVWWTSTTISTDPTLSRDYQIQAGTFVGYSGGPLIDGTGAILGTASFGDVIANTQVVARQLYLPANDILNFMLATLPVSPNWSGDGACTFAANLHTLTIFDWAQLSVHLPGSSGQPSPTQCSCCCQSMDKMRNQYIAPDFLKTSQLLTTCGRPFCTNNAFTGSQTD